MTQYDMKIHLPQTLENMVQAYQTQNIELFENTYEIIKELMNHDKTHSDFLILLTQTEGTYKQTIQGQQKELIETIKKAAEGKDIETTIQTIGETIQRFDMGLQQSYAKYVQDRKSAILSYIPHLKVA